MSFMQMYITKKGALYSCDCAKCGCTIYAHEWADGPFNDIRDAMQDGSIRCSECGGAGDPETFTYCGRQYAGRYSADGYLDCTSWNYSKNLRALSRELRDMYGD